MYLFYVHIFFSIGCGSIILVKDRFTFLSHLGHYLEKYLINIHFIKNPWEAV